VHAGHHDPDTARAGRAGRAEPDAALAGHHDPDTA
jgi:hypothetical protein